jgi:class 3 adenylate cyclase/tetratricopeptide (TPR) repeat protein
MPSQEDRRNELEKAIAAQEAQRAVLGDAVVDTTIEALRKQLDSLNRPPQVSPSPDQDHLLQSIHSHIPKKLADKMLAARHAEGERRQVTVLFADIAGYTAMSESLDPEEVAGLVQEILKDLARSVYEHEGYVDKFIGDAVMAVFGAPVAHEDDAERALRAALLMMDRLEEFNRRSAARLDSPLGLHMGVNTGPVVAGNVDAELRMPYSVIGDTVNTASRLEGAAETGQILVSRSTWSLAREAFVFEERDPVKVKGKGKPLEVYELKRARVSPGKTRGLRNLADVFVGREAEMERLRAVTEDLKTGQGSVVQVTGEAGIGKSRLMAEWRREMESGGGVAWIEGRCYPATTSIAYGPFLDLIRRYSGVDDEQTEETARRKLDLAVERFFPGDIRAKAVFARLLALRLSEEEQEVLAGIPGKELRGQIFSLMETMFETLAAEGPAVFAFEDIHWADASSRELMAHLVPLGEGRPLVLAGVSRPEEEGSPPLSAAHKCCRVPFVQLDLSPLSEAGSVEMVTGLLTADRLPASLKELVVDRTEGNPFFVEELVRTLIEKKALAQTAEGRWEATALIENVSVPDTLQGLLMARLDSLPAETRWRAQQASVIGRIFLDRVLRRMAEAEKGIDGDLSLMEQNDLIRKRATDPEMEYMFRHALTQEVAYESLLMARRKELHRLVGEAMEELFADRIGEFTSIIGEHFYKGEAWEKACVYLERAGDAAARLYANIEGRRYFDRALQCLEHMPDTVENRRRKVDMVIKFAKSAYFGMAPKEILERLDEAEKIAVSLPGPEGETGTDKLRVTQVAFQIGLIHYSANRMREAIGYYRKVITAAPELDDPELLGVPSFAIGNALVFQGHMGKARHLLSQGMEALEKTEDWFFLGRAKAMRSYAIIMMGDCHEGLAEAQKAFEDGMKINSSNVMCASSLMMTAGYSYADPVGKKLKNTLEAAHRAIEVAEKAEDMIMLYISHGVHAWNLAMGKRFEEAEKAMEICQNMAKKMGEQLFMVDHFTSRRAEIALGLGRTEEAIDLARQAMEISKKVGGIWAEAHSLRILGKALAALDQPRWDEAEGQMQPSLDLFESGQNFMGVAHTNIAWGEICRDRGKRDAAMDHWGKAAAFFESKGLTTRLEQLHTLMEA